MNKMLNKLLIIIVIICSMSILLNYVTIGEDQTLSSIISRQISVIFNKATSADIIAGIDDAKYATAKALYDAGIRGGEWTLIERKTFAEAATSYTFSGLNGDVDRRYKIVVDGGSQGTVELVANLNADTTTSNYKGAYQTGNSFGRFTSRDGIEITQTAGSAESTFPLNGVTVINALSGKQRHAYMTASRGDNGYPLDICNFAFIWTNTADNVTSILVRNRTGSENGIVQGTTVELYKLAR